MNDGEKINFVDHGGSIIVAMFLIALILAIGAVYYRVYVKHDINFFITEDNINQSQSLGSLYGN